MQTVELFVGIDYHRRKVQVCAMDAQGRVVLNRSCGSTPVEVAELLRGRGPVRRAALEACSGAASFGEALREMTGWQVELADAATVHRVKPVHDKSDRSDAHVLADLCRVNYLPRVWLPGEPVRDLRAVVQYRAGLVATRKQVKQRILATMREVRLEEPGRGRWSKKWLSWLRTTDRLSPMRRWIVDQHLADLDGLNARLLDAERQLGEMLKGDAIAERLLAMPGIGLVTASVLRAFVDRFDRFRSGKQLARYCGVTPRNASSGDRVADAGLVRRCEPLLKTAVIELAQRLRRYDPRWQAMSSRMAKACKPASVVVGAIANRWTRQLHHKMVALEKQIEAQASASALASSPVLV